MSDVGLPSDDEACSAHFMPTTKAKGKTSRKKGVADKKKKKNARSSYYPGPGLRDYLAQIEYRVLPPTVLPCKMKAEQMDFWELFSPPRVAPMLRSSSNLLRTRSLDIVTNWNLNEKLHEHNMFFDIQVERPKFLMVSAPCTFFSMLMHSSWHHMRRDRREARATHAVQLLEISAEACQLQVEHHDINNGLWGFYAMEHPEKAESWGRPCIQQLEGECVTFDQCMLGLTTPKSKEFLQKRTAIKANCPHVIRNFSGLLCDKSHVHRKGGVSGMDGGINISTWSQKYLPMMVDLLAKSIVQALSG